MFRWVTTFIALTWVTVLAQITAGAQTFELPEARAGENYRVQIEQVLRDNYRLRLQTGSRGGVIEWTPASGNLPPGLSVRPDGFIVGMPQSAGDRTFAFQLRVSDSAAKQDSLSLEFLLRVKGGGLQLVKYTGPILTPNDNAAPPPNVANGDDSERVTANNHPSNAAGLNPQDGGPVLAWKEPVMPAGHHVPHFTQSQFDVGLSVKSTARICMLNVNVEDKDGKVTSSQHKVDQNKTTQKLKITLAKGVNDITVIPYANKNATGDCPAEDDLAKFNGSKPDELTLKVTCDGPECGKAPAASAGNGNGEGGNGNEKGNISQNPFSSRNRRFIVGFEQTGAASAESQSNPFLDLFLSTPLPWRRKGQGEIKFDKDYDKKHPFARFSLWGNVKLNSTPQQIATLANVTSIAANTLTEGKANKLTQAFEFVAGPEIRIGKAAKTHISFIAGWGAVTPLNPSQATQIFKTPNPASSQAARFFDQYPGAKGKEFIAFTTPDRDRFLRQYFAGFRFRSYRYDDQGNLLDQFPGMFDVTFGQNEAVTGGTFHKFVVGLEGFYSLPFSADGRRFLFLFGSARFKAGGPKNKDAPFILDTAESNVVPTDTRVFLANPEPSNRDQYRIGFGVDLIEVIKAATGKKKEEPKKD